MMSGVRTKLWRESASLIILATANTIAVNDSSYKVLAFIRSEKTSFMPKHTVFPGGACDAMDQSPEWLKHFKNLGVTDRRLAEITTVNESNRPPIFHSKEPEEIKKEISLRITAIRETFEEMGVLICRKKDEVNKESVFGSFIKNFDKIKWQKDVHDDPKKFLDLCKKLEVVPDLWSLYEWSVWLTPTVFQRRFETAFFLVALNELPEVIPEKTEVFDFSWKTPEEYLIAFKNDELWLPPPQFYEFGRLRKVHDLDKVANFAKMRNVEGTTLFLPTQFRCSDGVVHVLVGDDFYPENHNQSKKAIKTYANETMELFRLRANNLHRIEMRSFNDFKVFMNLEPFNKHLSPVLENFIRNKL